MLGLVILGFMISFLHAHGFLIGQVIGMLTRIMMTSAIYNKVSFKFSVNDAVLDTSNVNFVSSDPFY